jgi:phosphate starvation-inducible protein PhoH and related proteins
MEDNTLSEIILTIEHVEPLELYGEQDAKLNLIREAFPDVTITSRGSYLKISGEKADAQNVKAKLELMVRSLKTYQKLTKQDVEEIVNGNNPFANRVDKTNKNAIILYKRDGTPIRAKTENQQALVKSAEKNDVVFAIGPAGTGKTYVAVALAVKALKNKIVKKIILTRPAVEAGENLGFLPGDLKEKVDPYLRPLYDALDDMLAAEKISHFITNRTIEIAPLAFMRGRTLDNAFIILDEAQNATVPQLKMFLTRIGPSAKAIITGDLTQIDLPRHQRSGLAYGLNALEQVNGIGVVRLSAEDVVRHRLVKEIIKAFENLEVEDKKRREEREAANPEGKKVYRKKDFEDNSMDN